MAIEKELLGKAIRQIRKLRGITQGALAKEAGLQGNSVALIERGQRGVSLESLNAIADVLDVPAACLAMLGTSKIAGDASSASLVKSLQKLTLATVAAQAKLEAKERTGVRKTSRKGNWAARKEKPAKRKTVKSLELA